jgi:hypothetical protein
MPQRNPHLPGKGHSPLDALIRSALRRYGDFQADSVEGEAALLLLELANLVIDEIQQHPYWTPEDEIEPYEALTDVRAVPDPIIVAGLLAHLSIQQASAKQKTYYPLYTQTINAYLWRRLNGNTPIRMRPMDGGSNRIHSTPANRINGLPQEAPAITIRRRT